MPLTTIRTLGALAAVAFLLSGCNPPQSVFSEMKDQASAYRSIAELEKWLGKPTKVTKIHALVYRF